MSDCLDGTGLRGLRSQIRHAKAGYDWCKPSPYRLYVRLITALLMPANDISIACRNIVPLAQLFQLRRV